ncbi:hypothetical protein LZ30DRAFT_365357 [Colletotrichum cereale]|nr:hypothetical protein LZ30DRAFT_365357 [Colletotrichum cereale]
MSCSHSGLPESTPCCLAVSCLATRVLLFSPRGKHWCCKRWSIAARLPGPLDIGTGLATMPTWSTVSLLGSGIGAVCHADVGLFAHATSRRVIQPPPRHTFFFLLLSDFVSIHGKLPLDVSSLNGVRPSSTHPRCPSVCPAFLTGTLPGRRSRLFAWPFSSISFHPPPRLSESHSTTLHPVSSCMVYLPSVHSRNPGDRALTVVPGP